MATSFNDIEDIALITIDDYKIRKIYEQDLDAFYRYCDGFLVSAVPNFYQCRQSLNYNLENREFENELTQKEISILADLWAIEWLGREIKRSSQLANSLQTSQSFKNHSPAQHIKEMSNFLDKLEEDVDRKMVRYQIEAEIDFIY